MSLKVKNQIKELGARIKQARINKGLSQFELADIIGMSVSAVKGAEKGRCKLETFISIIFALQLDSYLHLFLPKVLESPILLEKATGKIRQRVSRTRVRLVDDEDLGW